MTTSDLYLESGPRKRKTMVTVLDLLGCVAVGATTEDALAATPEAIRAYRRFLRRHGETVDPDATFEIRVAEHITEGDFLGSGSPYIPFGPDWQPLGGIDSVQVLGRPWCGALHGPGQRTGPGPHRHHVRTGRDSRAGRRCTERRARRGSLHAAAPFPAGAECVGG